jgi:hypothetical protein
MSAVREHRVSALAHRIGLRLTQPENEAGSATYWLVEPMSLQPVYPGGDAPGAELDELEDWLNFPWE